MSTIFPRLDPHLILTNRIEAPTGVNAIEAIKQELILRLTQTGIGTKLQGEVLAKLPDGSFIAKIADLPVHVDLPRNPAIGQKISLSISQILPHPVFTLHDNEQTGSVISPKLATDKSETQFHDYIRQFSAEKQNAAPVIPQASKHSSVVANTNNKAVSTHTIKLEQDSQNPQSVPTHTAASRAPDTELSPAARLISQVLKEQSGNQTLAQIRIPKPLLSVLEAALPPQQLSAHFAKEIQNNVQSSGLFYESHMADWVNNKRPIAELKQEPQARLPMMPTPVDDTVLQHLTSDQHEQLSQLVSQQLNVLDQQGLQYQGWLTPNIAFRWKFEAQEQAASSSPSSQDDTKKSWNSKLEIDLPELGKLAINLTLQHNQLALHLQGNRADTIDKLNANFPELASHLRKLGTDIVSYQSNYHELP